jgi:hypothetical protein
MLNVMASIFMARVAAITYDGLPISSGGAHKLRTRGFTAGLNALQNFANASSLDPIPTGLAVEVLEGDGVPKAFSSALLAEFDARFTKKTVRQIGEYTGHQWTIDPISLNRIVEKFDNLRPIPQAEYAGHAVLVHATWNLVFFDSKTRQPLPYQTRPREQIPRAG